MQKSILLLFLVLLVNPIVKSQQSNKQKQQDDYYAENFARNTDHIYKDYIKTLQLHKRGDEQSYPVIRLNSDEKLLLSFDDLQADNKDFIYTLIHCDAYWNKSEIQPYEYLEGYQTDFIENYETSLGTDLPYTHYKLTFPTEYLNVSKSGNYIIKVYTEDKGEENIMLTARFMVVDPKVKLTAKVKKKFTEEDQPGYNQAVDFTIHANNFNIIDPSINLKIVLMQNRRWDNTIPDLKPTSNRGTIIEYLHLEGNDFISGNECRHFDIKDLRNRSEFVKSIESTPQGYHIILHPDKNKKFKQYVTKKDLNGRYLIRSRLDRIPETESEYVDVHFFLPYNYPLGIGDIYIIGQLTNWQLTPKGKMNYNFSRKGYEKTMLLKQGYYDYLYAFRDSKSMHGDVTIIEGNHFETENEYAIFVYYRQPGTHYDQLISFKTLSSIKQ